MELGILVKLLILFPPSLQSLILATPLSTIAKPPDKIRWKHSKSGQFSIKTAYASTVPSNLTSSSQNFKWKKIWQIEIPYKHKMLLWNVVHTILPVGNRLKIKIPFFDPTCVRCGDAEEDHLHLFKYCPSSSGFWNIIFAKNSVAKKIDLFQFQNNQWWDWITFNLSQDKNWKVVFAIAIWHIWNYRNTAVFEGSMTRIQSLFVKFNTDLYLNKKILQTHNGIPIRSGSPVVWTLPQMGYKKLNTDGSWKGENKAGGGGVIRNDDGSWLVGFTIKLRAVSPEAAELITIREGLIAAKKFNLHHLELETNADALKKMLQNAEEYLHHELGMIIQDIVRLLDEDWIVIILHNKKRQANVVAHGLAKMGAQLPDDDNDIKYYYYPPRQVAREFDRDPKRN